MTISLEPRPPAVRSSQTVRRSSSQFWENRMAQSFFVGVATAAHPKAPRICGKASCVQKTAPFVLGGCARRRFRRAVQWRTPSRRRRRDTRPLPPRRPTELEFSSPPPLKLLIATPDCYASQERRSPVWSANELPMSSRRSRSFDLAEVCQPRHSLCSGTYLSRSKNGETPKLHPPVFGE